MHSATSYDTKLNPHKPSLSSCTWLCNQSALLPGAFFYYPTFDFQRAIKLLPVTLPTWKAPVSCSSRRELSVAGLRSTGDLLVATQPLSKVLSEDRARAANHLQGAFAKTKKATNILRPAIDVSFWPTIEDFLCTALSVLKKKLKKKSKKKSF